MPAPLPQTRLERAGDIAARIGSLEPSDPAVRRGLHASIAVVVALGLVLAVVAALGDFPDQELRFEPLPLVIALAAMSVYLIGSAEIWRRLLDALGPELEPVGAAGIWFASGLGRYVPGAVLLPMVRMAMAERRGVPKRVCAASVVYEAALLLTASLLVGAYFVVSLPDLEGVWQRWIVLALPVVAIVALQPRFFHGLADRALRRLGREGLPRSLPPVRIFEFVALYAAACAVAGVAVYGLADCMHPVEAADLPVVIGSYAVANTLSILAFMIPGGLGAREAAMAAALSPALPGAPALAVAIGSRILQVGLEIAFAVAAPLLARRRASPGGRPRGQSGRPGGTAPGSTDRNRAEMS